MCDPGRLSEVVGDIYDAALDPSRWTGVLDKAAQFVGGTAAWLLSKDALGKTGSVAFGISPEYQRLYFDRYTRLDPKRVSNLVTDARELIVAADIIPYDKFLETRFYQQWARPQGFVDFVAAILDRSAAGAAMFGVFRHEREGVTDDEARRRMRLIVPHFRRAVPVARLFDLKSTKAATLAGMLDGLTVGIFLVDANGSIVHTNCAGRAMLSAGDVLHAAGGRIAATNVEAQRSLCEVLAAASCGDAAVGNSIALPGSDSEAYVANVLPLRSERRHRTPLATTAAAALFVRKAAAGVKPPPGAIAKYYKLTPTELRVLLTTVEVGSVADVAEALGIAESTVKTHLARLYGKTGANRQVDLVKLVAGFLTPLLC
jgi:DNA-binding CsgD family transcriptional regulator